MKYLQRTIKDLDFRAERVLDELHPDLRVRVERVLEDLGGRLTPYCGYRGAMEQADALARGASRARFGQSPHNYRPALACDLVLHPSHVPVRPHPHDPAFPDLWDDETPEALAAWAALDGAAARFGLERVRVHGFLDRPHVQLHGWKGLIPS